MKFNKAQFRKDIIIKRQIDLSLDVENASTQIGISTDELVNLEAGQSPTMDQFMLVVSWMKLTRPGKYFEQEKPIIVTQADDIAEKAEKFIDAVDENGDPIPVDPRQGGGKK